MVEPAAQARLPSNDISEAEQILLDLADYIYAHTSLKPMSKTLFLLSRCLLVANCSRQAVTDPEALASCYQRICGSLDGTAPDDDFDFAAVVNECGRHLNHVLQSISRVQAVTSGSDSLGLVFNTLLRGKFEGGEGLGTFLTPEEVVAPMVDMVFSAIDKSLLKRLGAGANPLLYGDICGGTGRFVYAIARKLLAAGFDRSRVELAARLFDQSSLAVDSAKLNFVFENMRPTFRRIDDSLTDDQVSSLKGRFLLLATNPPFGTGKYRWNLWLSTAFPREMLQTLKMTGTNDSADPAEMFFFRNLDLLAPGGALAIVLPDGVVQSGRFKQAIDVYEQITDARLHLAAVVSLPVATFSLGGTVAKTSYLVVRKGEQAPDEPTYLAAAEHVGFLRRGNRRVPDPAGNDLPNIAKDFERGRYKHGEKISHWRQHDRLAPSRLFSAAADLHERSVKLREVAEPVRKVEVFCGSAARRCHVSVLDVDETGLIDVVSATTNQPVSASVVCRPGDVLVSCINPRIWRVAVIPEIDAAWTCSTEFLVLRPKRGNDPWAIAVAMHHASAIDRVQRMAGGTSSSRQRVPKELLLDVDLPLETLRTADTKSHRERRTAFYKLRLQEAKAYGALHQGDTRFELDGFAAWNCR